MKRCPKCNRTYANDAQKFCTRDGVSLIDAPTGALNETVRLDSTELRSTQDDPEVTKVISRNLPPEPTGDFDPYKTILSRPPQTSATTGDLMRESIPPQPAPPLPSSSGPIQTPAPPPSSGPIQPPPSSAPLQSPQSSGPIGTPSQPLQASSGDLGQMTMASYPPPPVASSGQLPTGSVAATAAATAPAPAKKRSKLPLILGILAVLFVFGIGAVGAAYWFVVKPILAKNGTLVGPAVNPEPAKPSPSAEATPFESTSPAETAKEVPPYSPPADAVQFVNSKDKLDGKLAEHYLDFSFYYPKSWRKDPEAGTANSLNFAKVQRQLAADAPQEIFAVGWYDSTGAKDLDEASYPRLVNDRSVQFAKTYPEYEKVSEGPTKVGPYDAYEFRFTGVYRNTDRGDINIWGRVMFVPPLEGRKGVTLLMLASSLAPGIESVNDVGVKGELPMMLESFRFGK